MYKPLPDNVRLARSPINGFGLFAATDIPANTVLGITHVSHYLFAHGWIRTPLGGYYNHSDEPNCILQERQLVDPDDALVIKTLRDVKENEELTCFYTIWDIEEIRQHSEFLPVL
jgi:SET domain-containing protein